MPAGPFLGNGKALTTVANTRCTGEPYQYSAAAATRVCLRRELGSAASTAGESRWLLWFAAKMQGAGNVWLPGVPYTVTGGSAGE